MRFPTVACTFVLGALLPLSNSQASTKEAVDSHGSVQATTTTAPTCQSGSVNFITNTLPQQCFAGSRATITRVNETTAILDTASSESKTPTSSSEQGITSESTPTSRKASSTASSSTESQATSSTIEGSSTPIAVASAGIDDNDADSPLDTANFLSFEEWKRQNLASVGQSPEHVGQPRASEEKARRARPGINNALDVLGEDSEIELDFTGFGAASSPQAPSPGNHRQEHSESEAKSLAERPPLSQQTARSKDAGKTCKERTNYASFDCAATVLKSNPECKSASSVLVENKDSYMLNICSVKNKFFIVELCDDILIDTVVLANYEFFSSIFRTFRLSVSDRYPAKPDKWRELGVFEARNTREVQAFLVEQPLIWARYLRIEILTHYGNEYYCPVSLLRVHGTTMMEEFRHQEEIARGEYPEDSGETEAEEVPPASVVPQEPPIVSVEADKSAVETPITATEHVQASESPGDEVSSSLTASVEVAAMHPSLTSALGPTEVSGSTSVVHNDTITAQVATQSPTPSSSGGNPQSISMNTERTVSSVISLPQVDVTGPQLTSITGHSTALSEPTRSADGRRSTPLPSTEVHGAMEKSSTASPSILIPAVPTNLNSSTTSPPPPPSSSSPISFPDQPQKQPSPPSSASNKPLDTPKRPTPTSPTHPAPSTQESFFQSLHKRLQTLESNATLSMQYIEASSLLLRTAFSKSEARQHRKTEAFLTRLNESVTAELLQFRTAYDQLWQSTVIELEGMRRGAEARERETAERLGVLAREVLWGRRMVIVQSSLLVGCLGLVLFARFGGGGEDAVGNEVPVLWREVVGRGLRGSMWSPPLSPRVGGKKGGVWGGRGTKEEEEDSPEGPERISSPISGRSSGDGDEEEDVGSEAGHPVKIEGPNGHALDEGEPVAIPLETQSSPATPTGTRETPSLVPELGGTLLSEPG